MNARNAPGQLSLSLLLAAALLVESSAVADTTGQGQAPLKWTPHRSATAVRQEQEAASAAPAAAASQAQQPQTLPIAQQPAAPATPGVLAAPPSATRLDATSGPAVVLPEGVPPVAARPDRMATSRDGYAPMRSRQTQRPGDYQTSNRIPGAMQRAFDPANPDGILGLNIMRSPQGEVGRPVLAPEGRQVAAMEREAGRRTAARAEVERYRGGLAPRSTGVAASQPRRPDRYAMNADELPSVVRKTPAEPTVAQPGADTVGPAASAAERLPLPPVTSDAGPGLELPRDAIPGLEGETIVESAPFDGMPLDGGDPGFAAGMGGDDGLLLGEYPSQLHVESFYDDPYEYEDDCLPFCMSDGRVCAFLRRFGKPYYGWRWYRDFTASAGVTAFTNSTDLGINGNFGTNEYLNWAMPFWNAFGVGWQVGWRGTQTNFQPTTIDTGTQLLEKNARTQNFITTGFFTRAFEGRGLQGGAVYDYLSDNWFDNVDVSQIRAEISYVWGYHEAGFWSANNLGDQTGLFGPITRQNGVASTVDLYCGFYRLQFGDANEWKVWGGGTGDGDGIVGSQMRAPMGRSLALEGTFTYLIPGKTRAIDIDGQGNLYTFSPSAWNLGINLVYYPAGRSRRSLASPYRPLFEVADNGSLIRSIGP
jgi:hypothetical protein